MTTRAPKVIPEKLKHDFIIEALLEIRFDSATVGEVLFGRLADYPAWKGFQQTRLPAAEIPAAIRTGDPDLKFTPWYELSDAGRQHLVRIGEHVLSYHHLAPYAGWATFQPELNRLIEALFEKEPEAKVERLGIRYINAVRSGVHGIGSVADLDLAIRIEDQDAPSAINLNFITDISPSTACAMRIATPPFVKGKLPDDTALIVDVDVFTKPGQVFKTSNEVKAWVESAHTSEKQQFFRILKSATIDALREK